MDIQLAYGRTGLTINLPKQTQIVAAPFTPGVPDAIATLTDSIRQPINSKPLAQLVKPGDRVVIVHSDITRPTPNHLIMPVLIAELEAAGINRADITLLNGLGTPGFIEPHFFAGFSGGPKAVLPALCGAESVLTNHGVDQPFDIVVTTNSGYPLDQNLYQTVKGMSAAARIIREGGAIIMAAACEDGTPEHGRYAELLAEGGSPQGVLDMLAQPSFGEQDQWQVQIQALIQQKAQVYVYSDGLNADQIERALFMPCHDIEVTVNKLLQIYGSKARICAMPEGPQTIAYLNTKSIYSAPKSFKNA